MAIPYVKQTWTDGSSQASAARIGQLEQGIFDAHYMPAVAVTHNAAQTATSGVALVLAFNTERFDQAGNSSDTMHDTVTNNSRLTCKYAGVYQITTNVSWVANATGTRVTQIRLNGTTVIAEARQPVVAAGDVCSQVVTRLYSLAVNDYVETVVFQNSGGNLNVNSTGNYSPEFSMVRVA